MYNITYLQDQNGRGPYLTNDINIDLIVRPMHSPLAENLQNNYMKTLLIS